MGFFDFSWAGEGALPLLKELMSPIYELKRVDGDERPFLGVANAWTVGSMLMTDGHQTALHYRRSAQSIRRDGCDDIVLHLIRRGGVGGDFAGEEVRAGAGQILCYDRAQPFDVRNDDNLSVTLAIPRGALEAAAAPLDRVHGSLLGGPTGALLRDHLVSLARLNGDGCDNEAVAAGTLGLIAAAIGGHARHGNARMPLSMAKVRELIDAKLASENLSVDLICRTVGVSRSVLYRHFATEGGVEKYILERKLSIARSRLAQQPSSTISELALDLGFQNASHFSTAYRRRFGVRPSETLRGVNRRDSGLDAAARVAHWIRITGEPA